MLAASVFLVTLLAVTPAATTVAAPDPAVSAVRQDRPFAVWFEPQLIASSLGSGYADVLGSDLGMLPLGIELGGQIRRVFLSVALAHLPDAYMRHDEVMLAGRFYLGEQTWAPYAAVAVGWMKAHIDDSGGLSDLHRFAVAGIGGELALRDGFSLTGDLLLGPDFVKDRFSSSYDKVHLSGWLRFGIGYRF